ncbi:MULTISPECIES: rhamnogalacturonan acetylesterase [Sphingomonas]|uniref:rhamnogalacturonan acetylesterase n=1 Tax=Sphingomonas TaxID=13687 RepID=UPI00082DCAFA|nr:rhamnogalacturonan acetylesterase [Sphingomonas sp. CCH10-B3]
MILPLLAAAQVAAAPLPPPVKPIAPSKIILVGDSTVAVKGGWGSSFCGEHVTSFAACLNLARGGRSSGSYRAEGSWAVALGEMKVAGYKNIWVLIQFGHNDQPGKPGRSTDLVTEFPANLRRYVAEARAVGAIPILVTPLTRRSFKGGTLDNDLAPWADAVRRVAKEAGALLVDLNAESSAAVQAMGEAEADRLAEIPKDAAPPAAGSTEVDESPLSAFKPVFDRTHLGRTGADYFATMVTRQLAQAVPEMRPLLLR